MSCAVWLSASAAHGATASADSAGPDVKIQINDKLVAFPEAQPYIDGQGQTLVPVRPVFEAMGYRMDWSMEGDGVEVALQDAKRKTIELKTGTNEVRVDGKKMTVPTGAQFRDGTVYVPLRVVSESFGYMVQWDNDNGIAIVCQDGKYHSPAWYKPVPAPEPAPSAKLLDAAKTMIGVPYVWGGTTPDGFDCSGFVNYVFDGLGVDLPRTSRSMYDTAGRTVTGLQPGDLVFFNIGRVTTHVGIYMGEGQFISATTSRGVRIDSIWSSYWGPKYIGAKRVL
ncbi:cell wall lytic activity [Paenibacillus flagellatus]|uniref:Cell wall lytic activity n=1 Tax=Paenibacillus flagellatus TaxID=2211139 RepID=A0A2V5JVL2_9BACL|nr:cell wall lytic activity [Paenibacillus flagellatus]